MAKTNLELFGPVALAYLLDGPQPQTVLNGHVPISVLEHLKSAGIIARKMVRQGNVATAWWFLTDDEPPEPADLPLQSLPPDATTLTCSTACRTISITYQPSACSFSMAARRSGVSSFIQGLNDSKLRR